MEYGFVCHAPQTLVRGDHRRIGRETFRIETSTRGASWRPWPLSLRVERSDFVCAKYDVSVNATVFFFWFPDFSCVCFVPVRRGLFRCSPHCSVLFCGRRRWSSQGAQEEPSRHPMSSASAESGFGLMLRHTLGFTPPGRRREVTLCDSKANVVCSHQGSGLANTSQVAVSFSPPHPFPPSSFVERVWAVCHVCRIEVTRRDNQV